MAHNTLEQNLRFQITWCETNLRWLLGETPQNIALIAQNRQSITDAKAKLAQISHPYWPGHFLTA
jgi:hypothetical protein